MAYHCGPLDAVCAAALSAKMLRRSRKDGSHVLAPLNVALAAKQVEFIKHTTLTPEQRTALAHITRERGAVKLLRSTNSRHTDTILSAARLAWSREGFTAILATSSRADADRAQQRTGIHSMTTGGLLSGLTTNRGLVRGYLSAQRKALAVGGFEKVSAFVRYAFKASGKWVRLDEKTVVVIRNPDSLALTELSALMKRAHKAGAKLVFVDEPHESTARREPASDVSELLLRNHLRKTSQDDQRRSKHEQERSH